MLMTAPEQDDRLLQAYCKIGSWMGVVPKEFKSKITKLTILTLRVVLATCMITLGLYTRENGIYQHYTKVFRLVNCFQNLTRYLLVLSSIILSVKCAEHWYALFEEIQHFKVLLTKAGYKSFDIGHVSHHAIKFIPCYIGILLLNVWEICTHEENRLVTVSLRLFMPFPLFVTVLVHLALKIICNRYKCLSMFLRNNIENRMQDEKSTTRLIAQIKIMYTKCHSMVGHFNELFGITMFLSSMTTSFTILSCLVWAYEVNTHDHSQIPDRIMANTPVEKDLQTLLLYSKIGKLLGIIPLSRTTRQSIKWFGLVFRICLTSVITVFGMYIRANYRYRFHTEIFNISNCAQHALRYILIINSLTLAVFRPEYWENFLELLESFRRLLSKVGFKLRCRQNIKAHVLIFACCFISIGVVNSWELYTSEEGYLTAATLRFIMSYQLVIPVLIHLMLKVIRNRYKAIASLLVHTIYDKNEKDSIQTIQLMKLLYTKCDRMVTNFNRMYGLSMFVIPMTSSVILLNVMIWLFEKNVQKHSQPLICLLLFSGIYLCVESDLQILLLYCKIGKWLGVTPGSNYSRGFMKWFGLTMRVCLATAVTAHGLYIRSQEWYQYHSNIFNILNSAHHVLTCILILSSILLAAFRSVFWETFFEHVDLFRRQLHSAGFEIKCRQDTKAYSMTLATFILIVGVLNSWDVYLDKECHLATLLLRFLMLYELALCMLIHIMLKVIRNRYKAVTDFLIHTMGNEFQDEKVAVQAVQLMKLLHIKCNKMSDNFNSIFGMPIFLISMAPSAMLLDDLVCIFERNVHQKNSQTLACLLLLSSIYLGFTTVIVLSCDAAEKQGRLFTNICYTMYAKEQNVYLREELLSLAIVSEKIGPKFSAAGFYTVNQMFLSTFFSALTSYAIVCIQFSML
nr:unnamed protein product [Callosobruchus analis]